MYLSEVLVKFIYTITQLLIFTWSRAMFDESIGHGNDGMMAQLAFLFSLRVVFCETVQWNHSLAACGSTSLWLWVLNILMSFLWRIRELLICQFDGKSVQSKALHIKVINQSIWMRVHFVIIFPGTVNPPISDHPKYKFYWLNHKRSLPRSLVETPTFGK